MKSVLVIGAGASGLTAIKCCLDEGLEPTCFERTDYIGGLWHYTSEVKKGQGCVMKSTIINTSKEMMCYSDFPIPEDYSIFMRNKEVEDYFHLYADNFELKKYIQFNTEVMSVKQAPDFSTSGQWVVTHKLTSSDKVETTIYDAVLICTGHHANVKMPHFPGQEKFRGKILHSHDYRESRGYEDKRVVVLGIGNSGGDLVVELSNIASQVYMSTRRGTWVMNRISANGMPGDMYLDSRLNAWINNKARWFVNWFFRKALTERFDHRKYCLEPTHEPTAQHPTINDELPNKIANGSVKIKTNIQEFTENGVIFTDGSSVDNIDAVIFATGYVFGFPFLDKSIINVVDNKIDMFKYMYPPDLEKHTMAVIGCFQPLGAIMPISELQCRLATRVFKGLVTLPPAADMWKDIRMKQEALSQRYVESTRHTIQVDYVPFMDELSKLVGCKPSVCRLFLTDPKLAIKVLYDSATPYQYRLQGPGTWKGARESIFTQWDRTYKSLQTRPLTTMTPKGSGSYRMVILMAIVAVLLYKIWVQ